MSHFPVEYRPPSDLPPLEQARLLAEINLVFIQEEIGRRVIDPTLATRALIDMGEHSYKVSGMAAKQQPKEGGNRVKIVFNIPAIGDRPAEVLEVSSPPSPPREVDDFGLPVPPAYLSASTGGNLRALIEEDVECDG